MICLLHQYQRFPAPQPAGGAFCEGADQECWLNGDHDEVCTRFPVGMTHQEFVDRYRESLAALGVFEGSNQEGVEQTRTVMGLGDHDVVLGQHEVCLLLRLAVVVSDISRRLSFRTGPSRDSRTSYMLAMSKNRRGTG